MLRVPLHTPRNIEEHFPNPLDTLCNGVFFLLSPTKKKPKMQTTLL